MPRRILHEPRLYMGTKQPATETIEMTLRRFQPGDVAILQSRVMLTDDQMKSLTAQFRALVPQVKVVILNAKAYVVDREDYG